MLEEEDEWGWGGGRWRQRQLTKVNIDVYKTLHSSTNGVSESKVNIRYVGYLYRL